MPLDKLTHLRQLCSCNPTDDYALGKLLIIFAPNYDPTTNELLGILRDSYIQHPRPSAEVLGLRGFLRFQEGLCAETQPEPDDVLSPEQLRTPPRVRIDPVNTQEELGVLRRQSPRVVVPSPEDVQKRRWREALDAKKAELNGDAQGCVQERRSVQPQQKAETTRPKVVNDMLRRKLQIQQKYYNQQKEAKQLNYFGRQMQREFQVEALNQRLVREKEAKQQELEQRDREIYANPQGKDVSELSRQYYNQYAAQLERELTRPPEEQRRAAAFALFDSKTKQLFSEMKLLDPSIKGAGAPAGRK